MVRLLASRTAAKASLSRSSRVSPSARRARNSSVLPRNFSSVNFSYSGSRALISSAPSVYFSISRLLGSPPSTRTTFWNILLPFLGENYSITNGAWAEAGLQRGLNHEDTKDTKKSILTKKIFKHEDGEGKKKGHKGFEPRRHE